MYTDFLGNEINVGDIVVYSPNTQSNELVLAEVLEMKSAMHWGHRRNEDTGEWESFEVEYFKPTLQPLDGTDFYRFKQFKNGELVPKAVRKVTLGDCSGVMFHSKKEK